MTKRLQEVTGILVRVVVAEPTGPENKFRGLKLLIDLPAQALEQGGRREVRAHLAKRAVSRGSKVRSVSLTPRYDGEGWTALEEGVLTVNGSLDLQSGEKVHFVGQASPS